MSHQPGSHDPAHLGVDLDPDAADLALGQARVAPDTAQWPVWSTTARIVVTDPSLLAAAYAIVVERLAAIDAAASRFRADSEIMTLDRVSGRPQVVSVLLAELIRAGLAAAQDTDGDVDPTLGADLQAVGYDRDFASLDHGPTDVALLAGSSVRSVTLTLSGSTVTARLETTSRTRPETTRPETTRPETTRPETTRPETTRPETTRPGAIGRPSWRDVRLDGRILTLPAGVILDLGATAKAFAADHCAGLVAERTGTGVLISLGGDIATAGPGPAAGWQVLVSDGDDQPQTAIALPSGSAIATSSTIRRTWTHAGRRAHHILDPRTGLPVDPVWRTVTVAAPTCVIANTLSTAAVVRGTAARGWLDAAGVSARLVTASGEVVAVGGWPVE